MTYYIAFSKIVRLLSVSFAGSGQLKIARTKGTVNRIESVVRLSYHVSRRARDKELLPLVLFLQQVES